MSGNFSISNDQRTNNVDNVGTVKTDILIANNITGPGGNTFDTLTTSTLESTTINNTGTTTTDTLDSTTINNTGTTTTDTIESTTINNTGTTTTDTLDSTTINNTGTATVNDLIATTTVRAPAGAPADVGFGEIVSALSETPVALPNFGTIAEAGASISLTEGDWKVTAVAIVSATTSGATAERLSYFLGLSTAGATITVGSDDALVRFSHQLDNPPASGGVMTMVGPNQPITVMLRISTGLTVPIDVWGAKDPILNEVPTVELIRTTLIAEKVRSTTGTITNPTIF